MGKKIQIKDVEHSTQVQEALIKLGYAWGGQARVQYTEASYLYFTESGTYRAITYGGDKGYFNDHRYDEVEFIDGEFVPLGIKPPLGLRPRYIAEAVRIQEILSACTRYTEAAKVIPALWLDELRELNGRAA